MNGSTMMIVYASKGLTGGTDGMSVADMYSLEWR
jgi:hypothetical protein